MPDALKLEGVMWENQRWPLEIAPYPPQESWGIYFLPEQADEVRDAINDHADKIKSLEAGVAPGTGITEAEPLATTDW